jgi:FKBP-type peptidyl-prolyl cis-trans isomerase
MNLKFSILLASGLLAGSAIAYTASSPDRRTFLTQSVSSTFVATTGWTAAASSNPQAAVADETDSNESDGFVTTESGLRYKVLTEGTGAVPAPGQTVKAHYTGTYT